MGKQAASLVAALPPGTRAAAHESSGQHNEGREKGPSVWQNGPSVCVPETIHPGERGHQSFSVSDSERETPGQERGESREETPGRDWSKTQTQTGPMEELQGERRHGSDHGHTSFRSLNQRNDGPWSDHYRVWLSF